MHTLEIAGVVETYRNEVRAVRGISPTFEPGIPGLLGPNGAGTSTLMRMIATCYEADVRNDFDASSAICRKLPASIRISTPASSSRRFAALKQLDARTSRADRGTARVAGSRRGRQAAARDVIGREPAARCDRAGVAR